MCPKKEEVLDSSVLPSFAPPMAASMPYSSYAPMPASMPYNGPAMVPAFAAPPPVYQLGWEDRTRMNLIEQMANEFKHAPTLVRQQMQRFDEACLALLPRIRTRSLAGPSSTAPGIPGPSGFQCLTPDAVRTEVAPPTKEVLRAASQKLGKYATQGQFVNHSDTLDDLRDALQRFPCRGPPFKWSCLSEALGVNGACAIQAKEQPEELLCVRSIWQLPGLLEEYEYGDRVDQAKRVASQGLGTDADDLTPDELDKTIDALNHQFEGHCKFLSHYCKVILSEMLPVLIQEQHQLRDVILQDISIGQSMHETVIATLMSGVFGVVSWALHHPEILEWGSLDIGQEGDS